MGVNNKNKGVLWHTSGFDPQTSGDGEPRGNHTAQQPTPPPPELGSLLGDPPFVEPGMWGLPGREKKPPNL